MILNIKYQTTLRDLALQLYSKEVVEVSKWLEGTHLLVGCSIKDSNNFSKSKRLMMRFLMMQSSTIPMNI